jgi:SpoVK/Ycf46/Vps4 family AAA+-type ATPase
MIMTDEIYAALAEEKIQAVMTDGFPGHRLTTTLEWADMILDDAALQDLQEIKRWIEHGEVLMQAWKLNIKPGYLCLFHGPTGSGKSLAAAILGKATGHAVYDIDLVSLLAGASRFSIDGVLAFATAHDWILVFDEADIAFAAGHDNRSTNQKTAWLLQRLEEHRGIAILTSNLASRSDEAFARRFQSVVHFPIPNAENRLRLWQDSFGKVVDQNEVDLTALARDYEITGGAIRYAVRHAAIQASRRETKAIWMSDVVDGIQRQANP